MYADEDYYEGEFQNDKANGQGIYNHFNDRAKYQGQWKDDL